MIVLRWILLLCIVAFSRMANGTDGNEEAGDLKDFDASFQKQFDDYLKSSIEKKDRFIRHAQKSRKPTDKISKYGHLPNCYYKNVLTKHVVCMKKKCITFQRYVKQRVCV